MSDEYQLRKDVDRLIDDVYGVNSKIVSFADDSQLRGIFTDEFNTGTIDALFEYYDLYNHEGGGGGGDLSNYYTKTEINGILSSYVTNQTLEDYALKSELFSGSYNDLTDVPSSFPPSTHSHNWDSVTGKPSTFPPSSHNHDDRYYTESEVDTLLSGKADSVHTHQGTELILDSTYIWNLDIGVGIPNAQNFLNAIDSAIGGKAPNSHNHDTRYYLQSDLDLMFDGKADSVHTHDDRYYTESEVDTALNGKQATLVSGTNIRTVNGNDLLGSGDIVIGATGTIDDTVTQNSSNPVKSSGIYSALTGKANASHSHSISDVTNLQTTLNNKVDESDLLDLIYPIGAIYMSVNSTNPSVLLGGTWEHINNCFLLASERGQGLGQTGGEATHTLTVDEMPSHTHEQNPHHHSFNRYQNTGSTTNYGANWTNQKLISQNTSDTTATNKNTGGGQAHNNMPPYLIVNVWKRTA